MRASAFAAAALATGTALALVAAAPAHASPPGCDGATARAAAFAYLDSLVSHDASAVPLAPGVRRVENGLVTGRSAEEIREDLNTSVKYRIIRRLRAPVSTVGEQTGGQPGVQKVHVDYLLDVGTPTFTLLTVKVAEDFVVECGSITRIRAEITL